MSQGIILISEKVTCVSYANVKSQQFLQELKTKSAVRVTNLPKNIIFRELLHILKTTEQSQFMFPLVRTDIDPH